MPSRRNGRAWVVSTRVNVSTLDRLTESDSALEFFGRSRSPGGQNRRPSHCPHGVGLISPASPLRVCRRSEAACRAYRGPPRAPSTPTSAPARSRPPLPERHPPRSPQHYFCNAFGAALPGEGDSRSQSQAASHPYRAAPRTSTPTCAPACSRLPQLLGVGSIFRRP